MNILRKIILGIGILSVFAIHAQYTRPVGYKEQEQFVTHEGDWFTRLRALYILPNDSSTSVSTIPNSAVSVHPSWTGEFDVGYMFTENLGFDLSLTTANNSLWGQKLLAGTKIGTAWLLPSTLNVQWRFFPFSIVQPYVGAGVNFTLLYGAHSSLPNTSLSLSNSWGPDIQGGLDIFFHENWLFNLDFKYVWIDTEAHLKGAMPGRVHVGVNPFMLGFGFGRKW